MSSHAGAAPPPTTAAPAAPAAPITPAAPTVAEEPARTQATSSAPVRASDREREHVVAALHHALGEGRLTRGETDTRVAAAYASVYRHELAPLVSDLPDVPALALADAGERNLGRRLPPDRAPSWAALWFDLVWQLRAVLWGDAVAPPTARHRQAAALLLLAAIAWFALVALVAAVAVGS